jgi:L-cystine transport system permease protein
MSLNKEFMKETFFLALGGVPVTLKITCIALFFSLIFGFLLALSRIYKVKILSSVVSGYVSIIRGTPMVLQVLIVYSMVPSLLNSIVKNMGLQVNVFDINPAVYAYVVFTINTTALITEIFRSALLAVSKTQLEAALSVGLTPFWAYVRIIVPQAVEKALPNICTTTVNLLKGTSLAFMMSVADVTAIAKTQASFGYNYLEAYTDIFVIYIILCGGVQILFYLLEKRLTRHRRTATA